MPVCYAFANQKGGVGKTTTVVNVAYVMALWGQKVLVVDVDPQCNATTSLGLNARTLAQSSYELLLGGVDVEGTRVATRWNGLDLVPSSPDLAGIPLELGSESPRERASHLAKALESVAEYDYILIDSPPSLGLLTVNALVAAHGVIIPVQCEYLALEGLTQLMRTISLVRRGLNPRLVVRGVLMTMYDRRTTLSPQVVEEVRGHFPGRVFATVIPRSVRLSEAPSYGEPGVVYAPRAHGAVAYMTFTRELLEGDGWTAGPELVSV